MVMLWNVDAFSCLKQNKKINLKIVFDSQSP